MMYFVSYFVHLTFVKRTSASQDLNDLQIVCRVQRKDITVTPLSYLYNFSILRYPAFVSSYAYNTLYMYTLQNFTIVYAVRLFADTESQLKRIRNEINIIPRFCSCLSIGSTLTAFIWSRYDCVPISFSVPTVQTKTWKLKTPIPYNS